MDKVEQEISLEYEKETKNTIRYKEINTGVVGTIYFKKTSLGDNPPKLIKLKISYEK